MQICLKWKSRNLLHYSSAHCTSFVELDAKTNCSGALFHSTFYPLLSVYPSANCRDHLKQICIGSKDDYCLHLYKNRKGQFAANFEVFGLKSFLFYKCHSEGMKINSTFKYLNMKRLCLEQLIQTSKLVFRFTFGKFSICDPF